MSLSVLSRPQEAEALAGVVVRQTASVIRRALVHEPPGAGGDGRGNTSESSAKSIVHGNLLTGATPPASLQSGWLIAVAPDLQEVARIVYDDEANWLDLGADDDLCAGGARVGRDWLKRIGISRSWAIVGSGDWRRPSRPRKDSNRRQRVARSLDGQERN